MRKLRMTNRDIWGRSVQSRQEPHCLYKNGFTPEKDDCVYSDRMDQWNTELFNEACKKAFAETGRGICFEIQEPEKIEEFLSVYYKKPILLTGVEKLYFMNGYPYYCFYYRDKEPINQENE